LFYTGRISHIHEVRGKDGVGAKMDHMELEREKGITITSAATYCNWKDHSINIIDTPGHVDFTVEVERALRVLDGAILVLCSVGGVQSQSITVDRQMKRYSVPRLAFINKLDRSGANPWKVIQQVRDKLRLHCAAVQVPMGLEDQHVGHVDLVTLKAYTFQGEKGVDVVETDQIPEEFKQEVSSKRQELIECLAEVDDEIAEVFLNDEVPTPEQIKEAIRRQVISLQFVPVYMGSAYKNKGVQRLLDGVVEYLPSPSEVKNTALDVSTEEEKPVEIKTDASLPLVAMAFKLEEGRFGQLTYLRVYQGNLKKGDFIYNINGNGRKIKVPRLVRMHSNELQDISHAPAGEIVAMFGVECASGDTFTDGKVQYALSSMHVADPVMSLAITPLARDGGAQFSKALSRFQREDPTFRVHYDPETAETIISGMGELHLEIYVERMKREYNVETQTGKPRVNFRETVSTRANFDYTHKKQSGGQGQFGRVVGYIEPIPNSKEVEFVNNLVGNNIPPGYVPHIEKGFREACNSGSLIGHPVEGVRIVVEDGAAHAVDSSEMAFKLASLYAFRQAYKESTPRILEPVMRCEVRAPTEYQGDVMGGLNRKKGIIQDNIQELDEAVVECFVPLNNMFGYSTELRSITQGKGEFTMEYDHHAVVAMDVQQELASNYERKR
jgi:elongation factor G